MLYLTITATIQSCPTNLNLIMESGQIVSPNYPENYPKSVTCSWIITVPIGYQVSLKIHSFEVINNCIFTNNFLYPFPQQIFSLNMTMVVTMIILRYVMEAHHQLQKNLHCVVVLTFDLIFMMDIQN